MNQNQPNTNNSETIPSQRRMMGSGEVLFFFCCSANPSGLSKADLLREKPGFGGAMLICRSSML